MLSGCGGDTTEQQPALLSSHAGQFSTQYAQPRLGPAPRNDAWAKASPGQGSMQKQSALQLAAEPALEIDPSDREAVRLFFNRMYLHPEVPMAWTGNYETGDAGSVSLQHHAATIQRINWYRAMAGLPAATVFSPENSVGAQQAAFMMSVNAQLSHFPPATWKYYSAAGAQAAGQSNLALGVTGPQAIDGYINDPGDNNGPVGHRRWIFHPNSRSFGIGDVPPAKLNGTDLWGANALHVFDVGTGQPRVARDGFVAWPTRGYVPYKVVYARWSLSHTNADFSKAEVAVSRDGIALGVVLEPIVNGYAENTIVWKLPDMPMSKYSGTHAAPVQDTRYRVSVSNVLINGQVRRFDYDVIVFDPVVPTVGAAMPQLSTPASVARGSDYIVEVTPMPAATGYGLLAYRNRPIDAIANADFTPATWTGDSGLSSKAIGNGELRLYHEGGGFGAAQIVRLNKKLMVGPGAASISFVRSAGFAMDSQSFRVQVSKDDGNSWVDVYSESGRGALMTPAGLLSVSLEKFAGSIVRLRFVSDYTTSRYIGADTGWAVRDIGFRYVDELFNEQELRSPSGSFQLNAALPGEIILLPRVQYQGRYYSDPGPAVRLLVEGAVLNGTLASYAISLSNDVLTITDRLGGDGVQTVRQPFRLDFTDLSLAFDVDGNAGKAYRLYRAAFDRKPDSIGLGFWIASLDGGSPMETMAGGFVKSAEFANLYGVAPSRAEIITAVYRNVLHRAPDQSGFDYWLQQMNMGLSVEQLLINFSESAENKKQVAAEVALGIAYARWASR